jgi:nucleoside-diphosphate-sugar epimerase
MNRRAASATVGAMNVLVIGGNRFVGLGLVWRLLAGRHRVAILNRGSLGDPFGDRIERLRADRSTDAFDHALAGRTFDVAVDLAGYIADDAHRAVRVLSGRVGHYAFISSGQVYLVREGCPVPSRESDYDGPTLAAPPTPADHDDWAYGIGKRGAEDVLAAAPGLPSTRIRIPMVNGELDFRRRIESYVWRILDGGPLIVPRAQAIARHVYGGAVSRALAQLVETPPSPGQAFNLAQAEELTVRELIARIAQRLGARADVVELSAEAVEAAGLSARAASPFSSAWMSRIDPSRAVRELGFEHPPLDAYLDAILAQLLAAWPIDPPAGYAQRAAEVALVARTRG